MSTRSQSAGRSSTSREESGRAYITDVSKALGKALPLTAALWLINGRCPGWESDTRNLVGLVVVLTLFLLLENVPRTTSMASHIALQIGLIAGYLLLLYVFFWFSCGLRRVGTFYLVMDGSAPGITSLSRYAANSDLPRDLPDDTEVGFMVFGSGRGGEVGCQDQLQVVPPAPSDAAWPAIKTQLEDGR